MTLFSGSPQNTLYAMDLLSLLRPSLFLSLLLIFLTLETLYPRRPLTQGRKERWVSNIGMVVIGTALTRALIPLAPIGAALWAETARVGLFHAITIWPILAGALSFLILDVTIYWQHRLFHRVPFLWRFHRMHHADTDLDVTSGVRFHPIELLLSTVLKIAVVAALGAPAVAVVVFEIVLNATSLFNHSRLKIPVRMERYIRMIVVTPDMHRVHHSVHSDETNSNFGFNIPWWDRFFGTYILQPRDGHEGMLLGLPYFRDGKSVGLVNLLRQPFLSINRSDPS